MRTLASELEPHAGRIAAQPRMYVDANMPATAVAFMRNILRWDVLFVLEEDDLRRASDITHFHMARQLGRTLITLDHDYLDARRFPPTDGAGVLVVSAPDDSRLKTLLKRFNTFISSGLASAERPLEGRTLHIHVDWTGS